MTQLKLKTLCGFILYLVIQGPLMASNSQRDRVISEVNISHGTVRNCFGGYSIFSCDKKHPAWKGSNWDSCRIFYDPISNKVLKIEVDHVEKDGKTATYRLPNNPIFNEILEKSALALPCRNRRPWVN